jgi:hypothetical protein
MLPKLIPVDESLLPLCNNKYSKISVDCGCLSCLFVVIGIDGKSGDSALLYFPMYLILTHSLADLNGFRQQHPKSFKFKVVGRYDTSNANPQYSNTAP